jgi:excisionase family DNA binding protein
MSEKDELHDIPEGASRLKVKESWFYQNIHAGTLPFPYLKVGRYVRIRKSDLDAYIEKITVPAGRA